MIRTKLVFSALLSLLVGLMLSCGSPASQEKVANETEETVELLPSTGSFGDPIEKEGTVPVTEIASLINSDELIPVKVSGTILEVCQHTGCWLTFDLGNGENIMVNMKDHAFYVPKDAAGKTAFVQGAATRELISVDMLKHYAEDAGRSQEYIDSITEDAWQYTIEAQGVIIEE
jgi:hypothetical protein